MKGKKEKFCKNKWRYCAYNAWDFVVATASLPQFHYMHETMIKTVMEMHWKKRVHGEKGKLKTDKD